MKRFIQQLLCNHRYEIIPEYDDHEERQKIIDNLKDGEMWCFQQITQMY